MIKFVFKMIVCSLLVQAHSMAAEPDWTHYNKLLEIHTELGTHNQIATRLVDYRALQRGELLDLSIASLENFDTKNLKSREEILSFYINAYNLYAIKMITRDYPVKSIRDIGSFFKPVWKQTIGTINNQPITLHRIEHDILRKLDEPRIHFAIVCASMSCPTLHNKAYEAKNLDSTLERQTALFLNDQTKGAQFKNNTIYLSKIFDWFEDDFKDARGVLHFIKKYKDIQDNQVRIKYLRYDWSLNDIK